MTLTNDTIIASSSTFDFDFDSYTILASSSPFAYDFDFYNTHDQIPFHNHV